MIPQTILQRLKGWRARQRSRRYLLAMSTQDLQDIGLSRAEALQEAYKPFWKQ